MVSLRSMMRCIGADRPDVSVLKHVFGFRRQRVPADPTGVTAQVSLKEAIRGIRGKHVHINVIRVGFDMIPLGNRDQSFEMLDYAIYRSRSIFARRNLGIGRVRTGFITAAESGGLDDLASKSEAKSLYSGWYFPNDGLDVFVVRRISDVTANGNTRFAGTSPVKGSCNKKSKRSGLIGGTIQLAGGAMRDFDGFARTFAHEIGHFLGLKHPHGDGEGCEECPGTGTKTRLLMTQSRCVGMDCDGPGVRDSTRLTTSEASKIRKHCSVQEGC